MTIHRLLLFAFLFSILLLLPYGLAFQQTPPDAVFQGFLINPLDGNTYLAKMNQGWQGNWSVKLPYTAEPGDGAYLFLYYLFLGHLARWSGLSLILIYHLARWLGALFMLWALYRFYASLGFRGKTLSFVVVFSALSGGLGWLAFLAGKFTADFWVAEAYPFLSAYTNPHFPLGLGLILYLLRENPASSRTSEPVINLATLGLAFAALLLAILSPFGVVIVLFVRGFRLVWQLLWLRSAASGVKEGSFFRNHETRLESGTFLIILVFGLPILIYDLLITQSHPVLAMWNVQNLTPSPSFGDLLISFSPAILLALPGVLRRLRRNSWKPDTLVAWLLISLVLIAFPWGLQRRFLMGLFVPVAGLAVCGIHSMAERIKLSKGFLFTVLLLVSTPTPLFVILAGMHAVQTQDPALFLSAGEVECLEWMEASTPSDALVLASPQMGLFIPALTGRRVLYGHPFETAQADQELALVQALIQQSGEFEKSAKASKYLQQRGVDYLFWGAREAALGALPDWPDLNLVCSAGEANLYHFKWD